MTTYTNVFGTQSIPASDQDFAYYALTSNTSFFWPELAQSAYLIAKITEMSASLPVEITMPVANAVSVGRGILLRNTGAFALTVLLSGGATLGIVNPGEIKYLYLKDNTTEAGVWSIFTFGTGTSSVDASLLAGAGLVAAGSVLSQNAPVVSTGSDISQSASHLAKVIMFQGSGVATYSLLGAALVSNGFFCMVTNQGAGSISIDPNGLETIDGESTKTLVPGESAMLVCNGGSWVTIGYGRSTQFQFTKLVKDVSPGGSYTLTSTNVANKILQFIGTVTTDVTIIVPSVVAIYYVQNSYAGAYPITIKTATGTGLTLANTDLAIIYCDGTNVVSAQTVSAPASAMSGGYAGAVLYQSAVNTTAFTASGTAGQVLVSQGNVSPTWEGVGSITHAQPIKPFPAEADEIAIANSASGYIGGRVTLATLKGILGGGFKNKIINGLMKVDQRFVSSSHTITSGAPLKYCIDRFYTYCTGANVTGQQITLANAQNRYRLTGATSCTGVGFGQRIEAKNCMDMAGGAATLQVKLSSTSLTSIGWAVYYANSADTFGTLASPTRTSVASGTFTINSTEGTYSAGFTIPSAAITGLEIVLTGAALLGAQTLTFGDMQLEAGGLSAMDIRPFHIEYSACQRYYYKSYPYLNIPGSISLNTPFQVEAAATTNYLRVSGSLPSTMRYTGSVQATAYAPSTGAAARCSVNGTDVGVNFSGLTETGFCINVNNIPVTIGQVMAAHVAIDADMYT